MSDKPRILCLHGGGVSAHIFKLQMRYFVKSLSLHFRLVFADGPWISEMHEDLKPVYSGFGPCYQWASWSPHRPRVDNASAIAKLEDSLVKAMAQDDGTGEWVGLLGFSQGAKLAFSILLENQLRLQGDPATIAFTGVHWKFGVLMAGRAPPYCLRESTQGDQFYSNLTQPIRGREPALFTRPFANKLLTPTLHVHGLQDDGLELHRDLLECFASPAHTALVEWNGAHRIPVKTPDVMNISEAIITVAKEACRDEKGIPTVKRSPLGHNQ